MTHYPTRDNRFSPLDMPVGGRWVSVAYAGDGWQARRTTTVWAARSESADDAGIAAVKQLASCHRYSVHLIAAAEGCDDEAIAAVTQIGADRARFRATPVGA